MIGEYFLHFGELNSEIAVELFMWYNLLSEEFSYYASIIETIYFVIMIFNSIFYESDRFPFFYWTNSKFSYQWHFSENNSSQMKFMYGNYPKLLHLQQIELHDLEKNAQAICYTTICTHIAICKILCRCGNEIISYYFCNFEAIYFITIKKIFTFTQPPP